MAGGQIKSLRKILDLPAPVLVTVRPCAVEARRDAARPPESQHFIPIHESADGIWTRPSLQFSQTPAGGLLGIPPQPGGLGRRPNPAHFHAH